MNSKNSITMALLALSVAGSWAYAGSWDPKEDMKYLASLSGADLETERAAREDQAETGCRKSWTQIFSGIFELIDKDSHPEKNPCTDYQLARERVELEVKKRAAVTLGQSSSAPDAGVSAHDTKKAVRVSVPTADGNTSSGSSQAGGL